MDIRSSETKIDTTSAFSVIQYQNFNDIEKWLEQIVDNEIASHSGKTENCSA